ncbi:peptidoglycan DD-metalloendopeptidase family protein [Phaeodactylibacter sp.]|uniref:peptidoglycan DD-metalloendopeptidase family protein n=1 Tax=Phaeodactylibacter sp. TaxID=1940289 RepID=UPI0025EE60AF|nr:peptidoglycan DD-metalloendopeptidase family protein [Phaeodactylibacter sp.]MCI4647366.1 peptidoglycan DD-metalloendopeptidase family protein [Phaeodactylibacter sp.]MCI5093777.1 peptidoglycan DD-metalloendopeptidase family protein [Phaeodactylibacter sp.]
MDLPESINHFYRQHKRTIHISALSVAVLLAGTAIFYAATQLNSKKGLRASLSSAEAPVELSAFPTIVPTMKYGFAIDTLQLQENTIQSGQFLADILLGQQLDYPSIEKLVANMEDVFDVRHLRVGKPYTILSKPGTEQPLYMVYEPNDYEYVVFELSGDYKVERKERIVETQQGSVAGKLESSLWNAIVGQGLSYELAAKMEGALQWSIDFHHLQKNDEFKLVFDREFIDGEEVGIGAVHAAYYKTGENEYHAIYYKSEDEAHEGYYDLEGRPMKRGFLKSPVKYSRISSYYNLNRFHPILKRRRPHYGTDYAAPYGTPIYAVGDGVVTRASYTKGNGNFVKIKHDKTYETQYLHMQKFAKGISVGTHVKQGQVIGYVGSTGLATGPHVCFRFWKDGKQVNHLNMKFPPAKPLPDSELSQFGLQRDRYMELLNNAKPNKMVSEETDEATGVDNP